MTSCPPIWRRASSSTTAIRVPCVGLMIAISVGASSPLALAYRSWIWRNTFTAGRCSGLSAFIALPYTDCMSCISCMLTMRRAFSFSTGPAIEAM